MKNFFWILRERQLYSELQSAVWIVNIGAGTGPYEPENLPSCQVLGNLLHKGLMWEQVAFGRKQVMLFQRMGIGLC